MRWLRPKYFAPATLAAALSIFFALTLFPISYPGLHYDELFFVNAALGDLNGFFVFAKLGALPLYLMPYIGALKAWIYWPIFKVFGVSVWSIRLPVLLLAAGGIALLFRLAKILGGAWVAALTVFLLVANPTFVWGIKSEVGPVAIEFFLQVAGAYAFFTGAGAPVLTALFILGMFNKISFIWWVAGLVAAGTLFFPARRRALLIAGGLSALFLPAWNAYFHFVSAAGEFSSFSAAARWEYMNPLWQAVLEGVNFYRLVFDPYAGIQPNAKHWAVVVFLGWFYFGFVSRNKENRNAIRFLGVQILVTFTCIFFTARATAYWHFLHLIPWFALLSALVLQRLRYAGAAIAVLFLFELSVVSSAYVRKTGAAPINPYWSTATYPLINWCRAENRKCVSLEWGTQNQIFSFVRDPRRAWEFLANPALDPELHYVAYSYGAGRGVMDRKADFFTLVEKAGKEAEIETRFDEKGKTIFEVYRITEKGIPAPPLKSK